MPPLIWWYCMGGGTGIQLGGDQRSRCDSSLPHSHISCGRSRLANLKCLGPAGTAPLSFASCVLCCMAALCAGALAHGFQPYCVILLFHFLSCGFQGQGFLKTHVPSSTFRRASLMESFQFSLLECSKWSQVGGLGRILLQFI